MFNLPALTTWFDHFDIYFADYGICHFVLHINKMIININCTLCDLIMLPHNYINE